jgi:hypothetical protein
MPYEERLETARKLRLAVYTSMGTPSKDVLAPLLGPAVTGGPAWPSRPSWRAIRRGETLIVASDALSDPWEEDEEEAGYRLEVFMEGPGDLLPEGAPLTDLTGTWLLSAVQEISNTVASHGGVRELLDELGAVSVEVDGAHFPDALCNEEGRVGVLVGVATKGLPERIDYGNDDALLVAVTVLTRDELDTIVEEGTQARLGIAEALAASSTGHRSVLDRKSVLEDPDPTE